MSIANILGAIPIDLISVIGAGIVAIFKSIKFIQEGERGVKLRFGKAVRVNGSPKIYEPGFAFLIPFVDTLKRHAVRQQTLPFNDQRILLKNGMTFVLSAFVLFRVTNVYKTLFDINDLEGSLEDIGTGTLRDKVAQLSHDDLVNTEAIAEAVLESLKKHTESWGVEIIEFRLTNCAPSPETVNLLNVPAKILMLKEAAEKLGTTLEKTDPGLLSVLIGSPLIASTQVQSMEHSRIRGSAQTEQHKRFSTILHREN